MAVDYRVGDLVWAKMKGSPAWPGKIEVPKAEIKKPPKKTTQFIFFFGTDNYAWILEDQIWPYLEYKKQFTLTNRIPKGWKLAVDSADEWAKSHPQEKRERKDAAPKEQKKRGPKPKDPSEKKERKKRESSGTPKAPKPKKPKVEKSNASGENQSEDDDLLPDFNNKDGENSDEDEDNGSVSSSADASTTSEKKTIIPTPYKIGFLGLGIMGQGMVMNLLKSGHEVTVWNRTSAKCRDFVKVGALKGNSPAEVATECDITFSCLADPAALREVVFGNSGIIRGVRAGKAFVDMSTVDIDTVTDIYQAITAKGGRFLEAPVVGSRQPAQDGKLIILAAGDKSLYDDCYSCFASMGKKSYYLGDVGNGARMKLAINAVMGVCVAGLAEGMALAEKVGIKQEDMLEVLELSPLASSLLRIKGEAILIDDFDPNFPLQHQQKDLRLAVNLGDTVDQPMPVCAAANELYKKAKSMGYGENDMSAVFKATIL